MIRPASLVFILPAAAAVAGCLAAQTQTFRGGDVVFAHYDTQSGGGLRRTLPNGTTQRIPTPGVATTPVGVTATRDGNLVMSEYTSGQLTLVAPDGTTRQIARVPGAIRISEDIDGAILVASLTSSSIHRVTRSGQVSTVVALGSRARPYDVVVDNNGDYIFLEDLGRGTYPIGVYRVQRTTRAITPIHQGTPLQLPHGLAFFQNGDLAIVDGRTDAVYRLDRAGRISTFVSTSQLSNNPETIQETGDGGFVITADGSNAALLHVRSDGRLTTLASVRSLPNLEGVAIVPQLTGPTGLTTGPGGRHALGLDLPTDANSLYFSVLSASKFPGIGVPMDTRGFSLNPDALFTASITGRLAPVLVNGAGVVPASGRIASQFDLTLLPPGALVGRALYLQAFTANPQSFLIGTISNPLRFDFR